jgi:hypothetical protein
MFDYSKVEVNNSYELVEKGQYVGTIVATELKASKAGNNYMNLTVEIVMGKYKGRKIFVGINHLHANPQVKAIADGTIKEILLAVNSVNMNFTSEPQIFAAITGIPMNIKIDIQVSKDSQFPDKNVIRNFTKYSEQQMHNNMHAQAITVDSATQVKHSKATDFSDIPF